MAGSPHGKENRAGRPRKGRDRRARRLLKTERRLECRGAARTPRPACDGGGDGPEGKPHGPQAKARSGGCARESRERGKAGRATGGRGAGARQSGGTAAAPFLFRRAGGPRGIMHDRKENDTMKEAMESLAAVAMIAAAMGLAYVARCIQ